MNPSDQSSCSLARFSEMSLSASQTRNEARLTLLNTRNNECDHLFVILRASACSRRERPGLREWILAGQAQRHPTGSVRRLACLGEPATKLCK